MESETPPASPTHEAGDTEVLSRRSPDLPKPDANTSAALSPERFAHEGRWEGSGTVQCPAGRTDGLTGASCALGRALLTNERGAQEDFIRYKRFE